MLRKIVLVFIGVCLLIAGGVYALYLANTAPIPPVISATEVSNPRKPFVVKLHARWCPVCMITTSVWSQSNRSFQAA